MNLKKVLSLVMIYLIISLTFTTAIVLGEIYSAQISGKDEIPGVIKTSDLLVVKTSSIMPCSVEIQGNDSYFPMNCGTGLPVSCAYTQQLNNITGRIRATVKESGSELTRELYAYVDYIPPTINSFTISSIGWGARATYNIVDAANTEYPDNCSGIKKVELVLNGKVVNTTSHNPGQCNVQGAITGTIANFEGDVNTSINAYDYMGLKANKTGGTVHIEAIPPKISNVAKVYKAGTETLITKFSNSSSKDILADIFITVTDTEISAEKVTGNFRELDRTGASDFDAQATDCNIDENMTNYVCAFRGIVFKPTKSSPRIMITASDGPGNVARQNITLSFTAVNSAGNVTRLGPDTSKCYEEKCYVRKGENAIIAQITTNSDYNESDIRINGVQAVCYQSYGWACNATVDVSSSTVTLEGFDDLGNPISGESTNLVLDATVPKKVGIVNVTPECPTSSESMNIRMNITDNGPIVKIKAKTSPVSSINETENACSESGSGKWNCVLSISSLKNQPINTNLNVIVEDLAGNQLTSSVPVSVCVVSGETPELISEITTVGRLPQVDKKVASKIAVKVPVSLEITTSGRILERSRVDCSGTPGADDAYMINDDGLKPIMILSLSYEDDWDVDGKVHVNCTQQFKMRGGNTLYSVPEIEPITFNLETYNQPLGTPSEAVTKEIDTVKEELRELDKKIESRQKVAEIAKPICDTQETITKVNMAVQATKGAAYGVLLALSTVWSGAADKIWDIVTKILSGFEVLGVRSLFPEGYWPPASFVHSTGANTGKTDWALVIGYVLKLFCAVYTCKVYDSGFLSSIIMEGFSQDKWEKDELNPEDPMSAKYDITKEEWDKLKLDPNWGKTFTLGGDKNADGIQLYSKSIKFSIQAGFYGRENNILMDGMGNTDWWVNPYKSQEIDGWCPPANLFNYRKERQIKCMYLSCMDEAVNEGLPLEFCKSKQSLEECLYLEGAEARAAGGAWKAFTDNLPNIALNILGSLLAGLLWQKVFCKRYVEEYGLRTSVPVGGSVGKLQGSGLYDVLCGLSGAALRMSEIKDFLDSPFKSSMTMDVASTWDDACGGVDYEE